MTHPTPVWPTPPPVDFMKHPPHPTLLILWPTPPHTLTFLDPYFAAHCSMYFSNDKIVRKNFFTTSIIALPFGRQQPLSRAVSLIFQIIALWNSWNWNVIQQMKNRALRNILHVQLHDRVGRSCEMWCWFNQFLAYLPNHIQQEGRWAITIFSCITFDQ